MICDQVTSKGLLWGLEGGSRKIVLNLKDNGGCSWYRGGYCHVCSPGLTANSCDNLL